MVGTIEDAIAKARGSAGEAEEADEPEAEEPDEAEAEREPPGAPA